MARYRFKQIRLHVAPDLAKGETLPLDREQTNYLINVMRLKPGAEILVFNGRHGEWTAVLSQKSRKDGSLTVETKLRDQTQRPPLDYCFAPLKHARLDYIVQKATEMGAGRLRPILTRHSQATRINMPRMRANVLEACEQCGVLAVPEILDPVPMKDFLATWPTEEPGGRIIFCDEAAEGQNPLAILNRLKPAPLALLIGPEGGFSEDERAVLMAMESVTAIPLGPRILRADTAGVAALAVLQATLGDWRDESAS